MPFLLAKILNFQGSAHHVGVGSLSQNLVCGYQRNDRKHGIMVVTRIDEKTMKGVCQNEMFVSNII